MDLNYSWSQVEHRGPAQKIWSKVLKDILINKVNNQASNNLHNYPYYQNEIPIYATVNGKDTVFNPPFKISELLNPDINKNDAFIEQILDLIKRKRANNKASTFGYEIQRQIGMLSTSSSDKYQWIPKNKFYTKSLDGLHEEILDFYNYIIPTTEEKLMRQKVVDKLRTVVLKEWPEAQVDVFGSFKTDLHLPTSDIDVVIFGNYDNPLWKLNEIIKRSGISNDCKVLDKATVPIVKMTDKETDVRIDISFNMKNGVKSANLIKDYIKKYKNLPHLVLLLKQYLLQRDLNEVWTGGISSYSLILMCVSFMKHYNKSKPNATQNLGKLFISFLEMYGRKYDYANTGIRTEGDICYVPKEDILKNMDGSHWSSILCIEDPLNPGNDIGRSSYGALHVKLAFEYAYRMLFNVVLPQSSHLYENQQSILGRIIYITPEVVAYRNTIKAKYSINNLESADEESNNPCFSIIPNTNESVIPESNKNELIQNSNNNNPKYSKCNNISEKGDIPSSYPSSTSSITSKKNQAHSNAKSTNKKSSSNTLTPSSTSSSSSSINTKNRNLSHNSNNHNKSHSNYSAQINLLSSPTSSSSSS